MGSKGGFAFPKDDHIMVGLANTQSLMDILKKRFCEMDFDQPPKHKFLLPLQVPQKFTGNFDIFGLDIDAPIGPVIILDNILQQVREQLGQINATDIKQIFLYGLLVKNLQQSFHICQSCRKPVTILLDRVHFFPSVDSIRRVIKLYRTDQKYSQDVLGIRDLFVVFVIEKVCDFS